VLFSFPKKKKEMSAFLREKKEEEMSLLFF